MYVVNDMRDDSVIIDDVDENEVEKLVVNKNASQKSLVAEKKLSLIKKKV